MSYSNRINASRKKIQEIVLKDKLIINWLAYTSEDSATGIVSTIPFTEGFHEVEEDDCKGFVYVEGKVAAFSYDKDTAYKMFLHGTTSNKQMIDEHCCLFFH